MWQKRTFCVRGKNVAIRSPRRLGEQRWWDHNPKGSHGIEVDYEMEFVGRSDGGHFVFSCKRNDKSRSLR
jgi:hypothetical protein